MDEKPRRFKKFLTDRNISLAIRAWAAGAVYFFVGWGTFLGQQESLIDLVVTLGLVMGLFNILIINPGLRLMFHLAPKHPPQDNTYFQKLSDYLVELIRSILIIICIALVYIAINLLLINLFALPADAVPLPGEPILFGVFYALVFVLFESLGRRIAALAARK